MTKTSIEAMLFVILTISAKFQMNSKQKSKFLNSQNTNLCSLKDINVFSICTPAFAR